MPYLISLLFGAGLFQAISMFSRGLNEYVNAINATRTSDAKTKDETLTQNKHRIMILPNEGVQITPNRYVIFPEKLKNSEDLR